MSKQVHFVGLPLAPVARALTPAPPSAAPLATSKLCIDRSPGNPDDRAREEKRGAVLDSLRPVSSAVCYMSFG